MVPLHSIIHIHISFNCMNLSTVQILLISFQLELQTAKCDFLGSEDLFLPKAMLPIPDLVKMDINVNFLVQTHLLKWISIYAYVVLP